MWMTFCASASVSTGDATAAGGAVVISIGMLGGSVEGAGVSGGSAGAAALAFGVATGFSNDARIREIGGSTSRFGFTSPSSAALRGFFLSISDKLSTSCRDAGAVSGAVFASAG